jgi:hypothetical protein
VVTVGGVDTYYDYDEQCWKYRRLGGGPVYDRAACPAPPGLRGERDEDAQSRSRAGTQTRRELIRGSHNASGRSVRRDPAGA